MLFREPILSFISSYIRPPLLGWDISDRSVKYMRINGRQPSGFDCFGSFIIPPKLIEQGEIQSEPDLVKIFKEEIRKRRGLKSSFIIASLPEEKSFVRVIQLPKIKHEDVAGAVRWEIEANIPLSPEELMYDFEIIEPIENHLDHFDVLITAFPRTIVDSYVRVLKESGFHLWALELESQAIVRATVPALCSRTALIVVDMGYMRTSFIVFSAGAILFTTTIGLGGATLEDNLSKALKISPEEAKRVKVEVGLNKHEQEGAIFSAILPAVSVLADELRRSIEYYQDHAGHLHGADSSIDEVLLVGGDASLNGLRTYLATILRIPVHMGDPFAGLRAHTQSSLITIPRHESFGFATACGLALKNLREE